MNRILDSISDPHCGPASGKKKQDGKPFSCVGRARILGSIRDDDSRVGHKVRHKSEGCKEGSGSLSRLTESISRS